MNKKGVELAINTIVILIISIVILGLGIGLLAKVFGTAEQTLPGIDDRIQAQLERALSTGAVVEIPLSTKTIGAGDLAIFNLGILHDPAVSNTPTFQVIIQFNQGLDRSGVPFTTPAKMIDALLLPPGPPVFSDTSYDGRQTLASIKANEVKVIPIGVVPRQGNEYRGPGQYFYNVCVCKTGCGGPTSVGTPIIGSQNCNSDTAASMSTLYGFATFSVIVR